MLVRILCPGPSLAGYLRERPAADAVIAVNRAIEASLADWWVFVDSVFERFRPLGRPRIFTLWSNLERVRKRTPAGIDLFTWTTEREINTSCPASPPWTNFSVTAAMVLADYLIRDQARPDSAPARGRVVLHGCDWSGSADWDGGGDSQAGRTNYRWKNEIHKYGWVERWLRESRQIEVERAAA